MGVCVWCVARMVIVLARDRYRLVPRWVRLLYSRSGLNVQSGCREGEELSQSCATSMNSNDTNDKRQLRKKATVAVAARIVGCA